jgi:hypothetical protein
MVVHFSFLTHFWIFVEAHYWILASQFFSRMCMVPPLTIFPTVNLSMAPWGWIKGLAFQKHYIPQINGDLSSSLLSETKLAHSFFSCYIRNTNTAYKCVYCHFEVKTQLDMFLLLQPFYIYIFNLPNKISFTDQTVIYLNQNNFCSLFFNSVE